MQLVAYGAQDVYLTGNPQITFFKAVYRRHTNFAIEVIETQFIGEPRFGETVTSIFKGRDADLLTRMYLKVELGGVDPAGANFAWIRRIGHAIIDTIECEIGGTKIDRQYGTWLDIWYELAREGDHERGYNHMIGDVPALTEFNSTPKSGYTLYIPLQFWFNRHIGLAIPLIALQYHDVRIHVTFANRDSVIISDSNFDETLVTLQNASLLTNYVYLDTEERRRFAQVGHEYLIEQIQFNGIERILSLDTSYNLDYNHPTKEIFWAVKNGNYTSGQQFVYYTHKDDWERVDPTETDPNARSPLDEAACKIVTESISVGVDPTATVGGLWAEVLGQSTGTVGLINITNNSLQSTFVNPNSLVVGEDYGITSKIQADVIIDVDGTINCNFVASTLTVRDLSIPVALMTDTRATNTDPFVNQFHNYGILIDGTINPVSESLLKLNGHDRFDRREGNYFNYVQPYQHHSNTPRDGINVYSFSLYPEQHQPSGTANLTRIDDTLLIVNYVESTQVPGLPVLPFLNGNNEVWIFALSYNILRIMSGLSGLAYVTT